MNELTGAKSLPGAAWGPCDPGGDPRRGVGRRAGLEQDGGPVPQPPHQEVRAPRRGLPGLCLFALKIIFAADGGSVS